MKRGAKVAVCYDGKFSRKMPGEVVDTHNGYRIKVRFQLWEEFPGPFIEVWFPLRMTGRRWGGAPKQFAGWVRTENSLMRNMFGVPGCWYSVVRWR